MQDIESRVWGQGPFEVRLQADDVFDKVDIISSGAFFYAGQCTVPNDFLGLPDGNPEREYVLSDVVCDSGPGEICAREIEGVSALPEGFLACDYVSMLMFQRGAVRIRVIMRYGALETGAFRMKSWTML